MKKTILLSVLIAGFFTCIEMSAQKENAIGFRFGPYLGVTYQHNLGGKAVLEVIGSTRHSGLLFTALYEVHAPAFDVPGMNWYWGVGGHLGFFDDDYWDDDHDHDSNVAVGLDGMIGLEYFFASIPLQLSLDWKPYVNLIGYSGFEGEDVALSVRYVF